MTSNLEIEVVEGWSMSQIFRGVSNYKPCKFEDDIFACLLVMSLLKGLQKALITVRDQKLVNCKLQVVYQSMNLLQVSMS